MTEINKLTVGELEVLHDSIGLTVEVNDGKITAFKYEEESHET